MSTLFQLLAYMLVTDGPRVLAALRWFGIRAGAGLATVGLIVALNVFPWLWFVLFGAMLLAGLVIYAWCRWDEFHNVLSATLWDELRFGWWYE